MLRSEITELKRVFEGEFASQCVSSLYTLKFHLLNHFLDDLERFESLSFTDAAPFEHFEVLLKQSYRMTSPRMSTRLEDTVENMGNALLKIRGPKRG